LVAAADEASPDSGRYLLCYDGSPDAAYAIETAGELTGGGEALLLNAWSPPSAFFLEGRFIDDETSPLAPAAQEFDAAAAEEAERTTEEGAEIARGAGFDVEPITKRTKGAVWRAIVDVAHERNVRAVVIGSQEMTAFQRAVLGSSALTIVSHCERPVIVVPFASYEAGAEHSSAVRRIIARIRGQSSEGD
jgi:nucleotide-binding universal stress UspA family protein